MLRKPRVFASPCSSAGLAAVTMMLRLPRRRICSRASWLAPSPMASMAMTLPTPNTRPSIVRSERSLCRSRFLTPSRRSRRRRVSETDGRRMTAVAGSGMAGGFSRGARGYQAAVRMISRSNQAMASSGQWSVGLPWWSMP